MKTKLAILLLLLASLPLAAQSPLKTGDVIVVAGRCLVGACADEFLAPRFEVGVLSGDGITRRTVYSDFGAPQNSGFRIRPRSIHAPAPDRIYFSDGSMDGNRNFLYLSNDFQNAFFIASAGSAIRDIIPMASGNLLVQAADDALIEFGPDGQFVATHSRAVRAASGGTLGLDQCTYYYPLRLSRKTIARFDVCSRKHGADFVTLPSYVSGMRVLPSGDLLVVTEEDVFRLNPAGQIVERYGIFYAVAVALTPDGRAFWVADFGSNELTRIPLWPDGTSRLTVRAATESVARLAVVGEWRPPVPMRRRSARR